MKCKLDKCRCNVLKIIILIILAIIIGTFIYKKRVQKVKKSTATIEQLKTAQVGNTVKVSYTGKLKDGSIFDSSKDREPLQFTIGSAQIIPGFEDGVIGLNVEEEKIINK